MSWDSKNSFNRFTISRSNVAPFVLEVLDMKSILIQIEKKTNRDMVALSLEATPSGPWLWQKHVTSIISLSVTALSQTSHWIKWILNVLNLLVHVSPCVSSAQGVYPSKKLGRAQKKTDFIGFLYKSMTYERLLMLSLALDPSPVFRGDHCEHKATHYNTSTRAGFSLQINDLQHFPRIILFLGRFWESGPCA